MTAERLRLIAWASFTEHLNYRVFYGVGAFTVVLFAASFVVGPLSANETAKIVKDLGLAAMELAGVVMALLLGVGIVLGDRDRGILMTMLSKPIRRWEWLVGQFAGVALAIVAAVALLGAGLLLVLGTLQLSGVSPVANGRPAVDPLMGLAVVAIAGEATLLAALATFFAVFSSSAVLATSCAVGMFIAGQWSGDLRAFGETGELAPWIERIITAIGWGLPAFSAFDVKAEVVHGLPVPVSHVAAVLGYGALYAVGLVGAAVVVFSRREIQ